MARVRMDDLIEHFSSELRSVLTRPSSVRQSRALEARAGLTATSTANNNAARRGSRRRGERCSGGVGGV